MAQSEVEGKVWEGRESSHPEDGETTLVPFMLSFYGELMGCTEPPLEGTAPMVCP